MNVRCRNECNMRHKRGYWTKEVVIQYFEDYISKNGNLPTTKTLDILGNFPKRKTIKSLFDLTYSEFVKTYFPEYYRRVDSLKFWQYSQEQLLDDFKEQYEKLNYPSMRTYDALRRKGSPSIRFLLKMTNKSFKELLEYCNIKSPEDATIDSINVIHLNVVDITIIQELLEK